MTTKHDYVTNPFGINPVENTVSNIPVISTPPSPSVLPEYSINTLNTGIPNNTYISPTAVNPGTSSTYNTGFWQGFKNIFGDGYQKGDFGKSVNHGMNWGMSSAPENIPGVGKAVTDYRTDTTAPNRFNTIFGGVQTLGNLWSGIKQTRMAEQQANMQRDMWNKTWNTQKNQINDASAYRAMLRNNGNAQAAQKEYDKTKI